MSAVDLLFANDRPGQHPDSWYAATAPLPVPTPPLSGDARTDVCVIGAGYTGLSAALHLAQAGARVTVLEAHRAGFGASGRNGGQLGSGQRQDQITLERMFGADAADRLWEMGEDAKALVRGLIRTHDIDCHLREGVAWMGSSPSEVAELHRYADHMARRHDHPMEVLDAQAGHRLCPSPDFRGGVLDMTAGHLHPLRFALGLARAAQSAGAVLHEGTAVTSLTPRKGGYQIRTATGSLQADQVVLACNGYLGGLDPRVSARVMPINNFIVATAPLGARTAEVLTRDVAACDSRFVVNYFRLSHDGRLLFGGGETYGYRFPADIRALVRKPMLRIFPHLADVELEFAWGGTLAITMKRLPHLARLAPGMVTASGYSGHGVGTAVHAGQLLAEALRGQSDGFDTLAALPCPPFPGGRALRSPLLALAMSWFALRDRLGL